MNGADTANRVGGIAVGIGAILVGALALDVLIDVVPDLSSSDPHLAGDATIAMILFVIPLSMGALVTLVVARALWAGTAWAWGASLGLAALSMAFAFIFNGAASVIWIVRTGISSPGSLDLSWPVWRWNPHHGDPNVVPGPPSTWPYGRMDDLAFWFPGLLLIISIVVLIALALSMARRRRGGGQTGSPASGGQEGLRR